MPSTKINSQLIEDLSIETADIKDGAVTTSKINIDADLNLAGKKIVNLADPVNASDAATKAYVDAHTSTSLPPAINGQTLRYDGTAWVADSNLYNDGTKIGIGITSPGAKLDVQGNIWVSNVGTGWSSEIGFARDGILKSYIQLSDTDELYLMGAEGIRTGGSGGFKIMNGNVGIDTTTPSEKLDVVGNVKLSGNLLIGDGTAGDKIIIANNADTNKPQIKYNDTSKKWQYTNDGLTWFDISSGGSGTPSGTPGGIDKQIQFNDNGVFGGANIYYDKVNELLQIGNFTTYYFNTNDKIRVKGNITITDPNNENNNSYLRYNLLQFFDSNRVAFLSLDNEGNLNISTTNHIKIENDAIFLGSPFNNFNKSIYANTSTWQALPFIRYNKDNSKWEYSDDGSNVKSFGGGGTPGGIDKQIQFNDNGVFGGANIYYDKVMGNVGIDTTTPSEKLDVVGNVKLSGNLLIGDGTAGDKIIIANNADTNKPQIKYNDTSKKWQYTNDGLTWFDISSGGSGTPSGTPGGIDKQIQFNDNGVFGGANIYYDKSTSNVGIDTTTPSEKLDVYGNISTTGYIKEEFPSTNLTATGTIVTITAGENLSQGDVCKCGVDGKFYKANATDSTGVPAIVITIDTISASSTGRALLIGFWKDTSKSWTVGGYIYLSTTSGQMTQTVPSVIGNQVQILGVAIATDTIYFNPNVMILEVA